MTVQFEHWPTHSQDEIEAVSQVLASGKTNYWTGNQCRHFEKEFAEFIGTDYAIALMNGTVALEAALYALDIGPGDEVITACRTFIASASCIKMRGAIPVLADIDSNTQNITAATIKSCLTPKTKAIIVVHLAGFPAEMEAILALAKEHHLYVIEDCAQAHGAVYKGQHVGSMGDIAAFSFCQDKIITTGGEGGMVTTNNPELWRKMWSFKDHGKNYAKTQSTNHPPGFRWLHDDFGTNWRMTEMQAAIGRLQLKKLPQWLAKRQANAQVFDAYFKNVPALRVIETPPDIQHAYYKYYVFINNQCLKPGWNRDRILQAMSAAGVPCFSGSCSDIANEEAFNNHSQCRNEKPVAKQLGETSLMFLVHPTLTKTAVEKAAQTLLNVIEEAIAVSA